MGQALFGRGLARCSEVASAGAVDPSCSATSLLASCRGFCAGQLALDDGAHSCVDLMLEFVFELEVGLKFDMVLEFELELDMYLSRR